MFAECSRFDWYQATVPAGVEMVHQALADWYGDQAVTIAGDAPIKPFKHGRKWVDAEGETLASVYWGGHNPLPHLRATSDAAPALAAMLRARFPDHRVSRLDVCLDLRADQLMAAAFPVLLEAARSFRLQFDRQGPADPSDSRDRGSTFYLGAPSAPVRLRAYEKGLELFAKSGSRAWLAYRDWVRFEVQWRPHREAKTLAARLSPGECWGATAWTKEIAAQLLGIEADKVDASRWRQSNHERALSALCRQYGAVLWEQMLRDGSAEALWSTLAQRMAIEAQEEPGRPSGGRRSRPAGDSGV